MIARNTACFGSGYIIKGGIKNLIEDVSVTLSLVSIAVIAFLIGVFVALRRARALTEIVPASRLQRELQLYAANRPQTRLDPARVPVHLRRLIPLAEKWGIGDDIIRNDLIAKASLAEKAELHDALYDAHDRVTEWLSSIPSGEMSDEADAFVHMQEALDEMGYFLDDEKSGQLTRPSVESPRHIGEKKVGPIPAVLFEKLNRITPSRNGEMLYYPCRVVTRDGRMFDRVYVQPRQPYLSHWGILPFNDPHKGWIAISEFVDLEESPFRLPPDLAGQIYEKGETGMGVTKFRVVFRNGTNLAVMTGNAVDFIPLPEGVTAADALHAFPLTGWDEQTELAPRYYWSVYDGVEPA